MIYHVFTDASPEPITIYAASSKWAARKWARQHCVYKTTVHVRSQEGLTVSWQVWPEKLLVYRVRVAP